MSKDKKPTKEDIQNVKDAIEFQRKRIQKESEGAEAFLVTFHVIKDDGEGKKKITHHFGYHDFPNGDWGNVIQAIAREAERSQMVGQSGKAKVE